MDSNLAPVWKRKSDAFLLATTDRRVTHGMFRVLVWLAERTFWRRMGGDTAGSIIAPRDDIARSIGADKKRVSLWIKRLAMLGYLKVTKINRKGRYPMNRYTIFALCPDDCAEFPDEMQVERVNYGLESPTWAPKGLISDRVASATLPKVASAPPVRLLSPPSTGAQTPSLGKVRRLGEGEAPPAMVGKEHQINESWDDWCQRVGKLFDRELETRLHRLKEKLKAERANPANYKLKLKKEAAEFISYAKKRVTQLDLATRDGKTAAADYAKRVKAMESDQGSYSRDTLNPSGSAIVANLTRKIRFIEERIH